MKATVIIPTYKRAEGLRALLTTLTHQRGDTLVRVVVCDDGSPDHTEAVATSFVGKLPLIYRRQDDQGFRAGQARNMGIDDAIGDVVIFVDDDVLVAEDFVESHIAAHRNETPTPTLAIGFRYRTFDRPALPITSADILPGVPDDRVAVLGASGEALPRHERPWIFVYSCNLSVRLTPELRDVVRFHSGFLGWGIEDTEFGYRLMHSGYRVIAAPSANVLHVEDPSPRDPFRCEERAIEPNYDTYVRNAVYFMDLYPEDRDLCAWIESDLRWYVLDQKTGHWVKNGFANDVKEVIAVCRKELAGQRRPSMPNIAHHNTNLPSGNSSSQFSPQQVQRIGNP